MTIKHIMFTSRRSEKFINLVNFWETVGQQEYIINPPRQISISPKIKNLIENFQTKEKDSIEAFSSESLTENKENQIDFINSKKTSEVLKMKKESKRISDIYTFEGEKLLRKIKQHLILNEILKQYVSYIFTIKTIKYKKLVLPYVHPLLIKRDYQNIKLVITERRKTKERKRKNINKFTCDLEEIIVEQIIYVLYEQGFIRMFALAPSLIKGIILFNFVSNFI